jgi:hypothetical protein
VLEREKPELGHRRCFRVSEDTENPAFFVKLVEDEVHSSYCAFGTNDLQSAGLRRRASGLTGIGELAFSREFPRIFANTTGSTRRT